MFTQILKTTRFLLRFAAALCALIALVILLLPAQPAGQDTFIKIGFTLAVISLLPSFILLYISKATKEQAND